MVSATAWSDGTETLGPPSIPIASGTDLFANGTGMVSQPGSIDVAIPERATVNQVLLYWEGFMTASVPGDDTITVSNGSTTMSVTGTLVGGPTYFFAGGYASTFRADITGTGLVGDGLTTLTLSDLSFTNVANGAGVMVIYDAGPKDASIEIRDGSDVAFIGFPSPRDTTVPQTIVFPAANQDRTVQASMFFASVSGTVSGYGKRPTVLLFTTNGPNGTTTELYNVLDSISGQEWDSFDVAIDIPAGATELTVQALSEDRTGSGNLPASFDWLAAGFAFEPENCGRMTGGGKQFTIADVAVTKGFEIHCDRRKPNNIEVNWPDHRFHMTELTAAICTDSPAVDQTPPKSAPFDTFQGRGVGRLNNAPGARIEFVFEDAGEPGTSDTARIKVYDPAGALVLDAPGDGMPAYIAGGNLQTHKDNKCSF